MQALGVTTPRPLRLLEAAEGAREGAGGALGVPAEEEVSAVWAVAAVAGVPAEGFEAEAVEAPVVVCVVETGVALLSCWFDEGVSSGGGESCSMGSSILDARARFSDAIGRQAWLRVGSG